MAENKNTPNNVFLSVITFVIAAALIAGIGISLFPTDYSQQTRWRQIPRTSLLDAMILVESGGNAEAEGKDGELGVLQIRPIMVEEVNRILRGERTFSLEDRRDVDKSIVMFQIYSEYWNEFFNDSSYEGIARRWNGGPTGHIKDSTLPYWEKVQSHMN